MPKRDLVRSYALIGAQARLVELDRERVDIFETFPELDPRPPAALCDDASSEATEDVGRRQEGSQHPDEEILGPAQEGTATLAPRADCGVVGRGCTNRRWPARCQPLRARPGPPGANVPERVAMRLTGHTSRAIFDGDNIIHEQELLDAFDFNT